MAPLAVTASPVRAAWIASRKPRWMELTGGRGVDGSAVSGVSPIGRMVPSAGTGGVSDSGGGAAGVGVVGVAGGEETSRGSRLV